MTDKPIERATGRPPMPSMAPPTEDIDAEWGADEIPAPARTPELSSGPSATGIATEAAPAPSLPPPISPPAELGAAEPTVAPSPSTEPYGAEPAAQAAPSLNAAVPEPSQTTAPPARRSSPPRPSSEAPLAPSPNPLRKQTLLGMAPLGAADMGAKSGTPAREDKPLKKQTLLGIAPPRIPEPSPKTESSPPPETEAAAAQPVPSPPESAPADAASPEPPHEAPNLAAQAVDTRDAKTAARAESESSKTSNSRSQAADSVVPLRSTFERPTSAAPGTEHELPQFDSPRRRWLIPAAVAAVLVLGIFGLRSLDRAPTPVPAELGHPRAAANKSSKVVATPKSGDDGDDDDGHDPHHGDGEPPTPTPDPEPLEQAGPKATKTAEPPPSTSPPPGESAAPAPPTGSAAAGEVVRVSMKSDPPGARMFWRGKEVGTTPFVLELKPGEKHAYELGFPGYTTRKVVVDGTKSEIRIGLRPDPQAPPGATTRK